MKFCQFCLGQPLHRQFIELELVKWMTYRVVSFQKCTRRLTTTSLTIFIDPSNAFSSFKFENFYLDSHAGHLCICF